MRLTAGLCKVHKGFWFKQLWASKNKYIESKPLVPKVLLDRNVPIHDPTVEPPPPAWQPPILGDLRYAGEPSRERRSNSTENHGDVYVHSAATRLWEGVKQTEVLTKSMVVKRDGLPQQVLDSIGKLSLPEAAISQDVAVQRCIFQANLWDPTSVKLTRREKPDDISVWKYKAEFGIPPKRSMEILVGNLLRLCLMAAGSSAGEGLLLARKLVEDHHLNTSYVFEGSTVQICGTAKWAIAGTSAVRPFVSSESFIDATSKHMLPDFFPMSPKLDLSRTEPEGLLEMSTILLSDKLYSHPHVHTAVILHDNDWSADQRDANAVMTAFGFCLAAAKARYGLETNDRLPQPIAIHCVHTDGIVFNSICFQLNTLDFSSSLGVKNLIWIDKPQKLFDKLIPRRAMLRNTKYENYNPSVFRNLLAVVANG